MKKVSKVFHSFIFKGKGCTCYRIYSRICRTILDSFFKVNNNNNNSDNL